MGFFESVSRALGGSAGATGADRRRLAEAWGFSDTSHPEFPDKRAPVADPAEMAAPPETLDYDRVQWRKKLKRILDKLPSSQAEWDPMIAEARALHFGEDEMRRIELEEFALLMRRAVADCHFTPDDHRRVDLARSLIGVPEPEAEAMLRSIVAEAEAFFGHSVEGA